MGKNNLLRTRHQNKRYKLKGYTNESYVQERYRQTRNKNIMGNALTMAIILAVVIFLWVWIKPLSLLSEIMKTIGY